MKYILKKIKLGSKVFFRINNWWDYFFDYLGLKKGYLVYCIKNKKIITRAGTIDKKIITELVLTDKYFPKDISNLKNPVIIDLGGHIGIFSILSRLKFENSRIYIVEPAIENFNLILDQIKTNKMANITPFQMVLSDKEGEKKLYKERHSAGFSLIGKEGENFESIKSTTLKKFFKEQKIKKCDILKMDIEGGEYAVLYSTPRSIFKKIGRIFLELHEVKGEKIEDLVNFLRAEGFRILFKEKDFVDCVRN